MLWKSRNLRYAFIGILVLLCVFASPYLLDVSRHIYISKKVEKELTRNEFNLFEYTSTKPNQSEKERDLLTFSNTSTFSAEFKKLAETSSPILEASATTITLPLPPANSSEKTTKELALLHEYSELRNKGTIADIVKEINLDGFVFDAKPLFIYLVDPKYEHTGALLRTALRELGPEVMRQKLLFDRVRPHALDATLTTVIPVPEHASYPSGHATQAFTIAFILSSIAPTKAEVFEKDAARIAIHREIAGVHYPSDSYAGMLLARHIVDILLSDASLMQHVENAKSEWE